MNLPTPDQIRFLWKQELESSKVSWAQFTEDGPLKMEGHEQKLASLLQARYAITQAEAETKARDFLEKALAPGTVGVEIKSGSSARE